jgi:hypothetical protein
LGYFPASQQVIERHRLIEKLKIKFTVTLCIGSFDFTLSALLLYCVLFVQDLETLSSQFLHFAVEGKSQRMLWNETLRSYFNLNFNNATSKGGKIPPKLQTSIGIRSIRHLIVNNTERCEATRARGTYPSGNKYALIPVHADSLHYCAAGIFRASNLLLHHVIAHDLESNAWTSTSNNSTSGYGYGYGYGHREKLKSRYPRGSIMNAYSIIRISLQSNTFLTRLYVCAHVRLCVSLKQQRFPEVKSSTCMESQYCRTSPRR